MHRVTVKVQKLLPLFLTADFSAKDVNIFELFAKLHVGAQAISVSSIFQRNKARTVTKAARKF
jgi:hypothetical protein